jgi:hypothetical protein
LVIRKQDERDKNAVNGNFYELSEGGIRVSGILPTPYSFQESWDAILFDLTFQLGGFAFVEASLIPDKLPWSHETFGGFGKLIFGVVVLAKALLHIRSLAAVISTGGLTLNDVYPGRHNSIKKPVQKNGLGYSGSPEKMIMGTGKNIYPCRNLGAWV